MPLAYKCLLSFGAAVVLIVFGAMAGPWMRMVALIDAGELEVARELVRVWERAGAAERMAAELAALDAGRESAAGGAEALRAAAEGPDASAPRPVVPTPSDVARTGIEASRVRAGVGARRLTLQQADAAAKDDEFLAAALTHFRSAQRVNTPGTLAIGAGTGGAATGTTGRAPTGGTLAPAGRSGLGWDEFHQGRWSGTTREYRYAKAVVTPTREAGASTPGGADGASTASSAGALSSVIVLDRRSLPAARLLVINSLHLVATGMVVLVAAMVVFYFITRSLVLKPVKELESAAERIRRGNFGVRARIETGDEFQRLAETLNLTLSDLQASQDRLRAINAAMDIKLHELSEANNALYQTAKMKGEFLASVSHELRTPLNSIIGFAELLQETARAEATEAEPPASVPKRLRYLENILRAGRNLLGLINTLLDMARIEAGKVELRPERVSVRDVCEGLLGLIAPLAEKKGITLKQETSEDVPPIRTDAKKLQQILFNFLSNAVKFTEPQERSGRGATITVRAERLIWSSPGREAEERVRISVIDNGPGISPEEQARIFDKFYQVHGGHTREHAGTGLGLAISRDLAGLLGAEIQVESEIGRGSMFSVILPLSMPEPRLDGGETATAAAGGGASGAGGRASGPEASVT